MAYLSQNLKRGWNIPCAKSVHYLHVMGHLSVCYHSSNRFIELLLFYQQLNQPFMDLFVLGIVKIVQQNNVLQFFIHVKAKNIAFYVDRNYADCRGNVYRHRQCCLCIIYQQEKKLLLGCVCVYLYCITVKSVRAS